MELRSGNFPSNSRAGPGGGRCCATSEFVKDRHPHGTHGRHAKRPRFRHRGTGEVKLGYQTITVCVRRRAVDHAA